MSGHVMISAEGASTKITPEPLRGKTITIQSFPACSRFRASAYSPASTIPARRLRQIPGRVPTIHG